ncbi:MAG: hypothetical protein HY444_06330 [Nitrospirae bacterium]|nr:hypothetical protein [Nitrospirota bacterium]
MRRSIAERPDLELETIRSFAVDHFIHYSIAIKEDIQMVPLDIEPGNNQKKAHFAVVPPVMKNIAVGCVDDLIGRSETGRYLSSCRRSLLNSLNLLGIEVFSEMASEKRAPIEKTEAHHEYQHVPAGSHHAPLPRSRQRS